MPIRDVHTGKPIEGTKLEIPGWVGITGPDGNIKEWRQSEEKLGEKILPILAKLTTDARCIEAGIQEDNEPELIGKALNQILASIRAKIGRAEELSTDDYYHDRISYVEGGEAMKQKILNLLGGNPPAGS